MIEIQSVSGGVTLRVKVVPGASRDRLLGEWGGRLKVAVSAPPERGKANEAVERLIAARLGARPRDVRVVSGHGSPLKVVRITGVTERRVREAVTAD